MYMLVTLLIYWSRTEGELNVFTSFARRLMFLGFVGGISLSGLLGRTVCSKLPIVEMLMFGAQDLFSRIVLGNAKLPFLGYQVFPYEKGWLYGWSWVQNALSYLPGPMPSYPVTFYKVVTGDHRGFTAPPDFYTEAYINGGWLAVVLVSALWGLILAGMDRVLARYGGTLLAVSISSMIATLLLFTSLSGIVFVFGGGIVACIIWLVVNMLRLLRVHAAAGKSGVRYLGLSSRV